MEKSNGSGGIGLFSVLFIVFLILKLCGVINWSWWIITLPLWGGAAIVILLIVLFILLNRND